MLALLSVALAAPLRGALPLPTSNILAAPFAPFGSPTLSCPPGTLFAPFSGPPAPPIPADSVVSHLRSLNLAGGAGGIALAVENINRLSQMFDELDGLVTGPGARLAQASQSALGADGPVGATLGLQFRRNFDLASSAPGRKPLFAPHVGDKDSSTDSTPIDDAAMDRVLSWFRQLNLAEGRVHAGLALISVAESDVAQKLLQVRHAVMDYTRASPEQKKYVIDTVHGKLLPNGASSERRRLEEIAIGWPTIGVSFEYTYGNSCSGASECNPIGTPPHSHQHPSTHLFTPASPPPPFRTN